MFLLLTHLQKSWMKCKYIISITINALPTVITASAGMLDSETCCWKEVAVLVFGHSWKLHDSWHVNVNEFVANCVMASCMNISSMLSYCYLMHCYFSRYYNLGMCRSQLKSESIRFGFCISNLSDLDSDLSHEQASSVQPWHSTAKYTMTMVP